MEKSTNSRIYLDYNSTSPFAPSVKEWLAKGDFSFGNPSSLHTTGKNARKVVNDVSKFLLETFNLTNSHYVLFHSGATEAINLITHGLFEQKKEFRYFCGETDHNAAVSQCEILTKKGHFCEKLKVSKSGIINTESLLKDGQPNTLLNATWAHNETGLIWPLEEILSIKKKTGSLIHVDAVQSVGKLSHWRNLLPDLDYYTYSSHKFGSLKGLGFTFVKKEAPLYPISFGGSQQNGLRPGTENAMGVESIKLALQEMIQKENIKELYSARKELEELLLQNFKDKIEIVSHGELKIGNTLFIILKEKRSDLLVTALDMEGIDIGVGSACSSGISKPNRTLLSMGYSERDALNTIRLSFNPQTNSQTLKSWATPLLKVLKRAL